MMIQLAIIMDVIISKIAYCNRPSSTENARQHVLYKPAVDFQQPGRENSVDIQHGHPRG